MKWLTVQEVAEYLNLHEQTVYRLIREGKIPSVKIGRVVRVAQEELDKYLLNQNSSIEEKGRRGRRPTLKFPV